MGLLIPVVWFAFYLSGSQIFVPRIFNPQWTDDVIYLVWPSFLMLLLINKSLLVVGTISVLLNVILYAAYGYDWDSSGRTSADESVLATA